VPKVEVKKYAQEPQRHKSHLQHWDVQGMLFGGSGPEVLLEG
jgi:hypothetical protein